MCFTLQYFFGPDILVAPVTHPVDNITEMATKMIWIPEVHVYHRPTFIVKTEFQRNCVFNSYYCIAFHHVASFPFSLFLMIACTHHYYQWIYKAATNHVLGIFVTASWYCNSIRWIMEYTQCTSLLMHAFYYIGLLHLLVQWRDGDRSSDHQ